MKRYSRDDVVDRIVKSLSSRWALTPQLMDELLEVAKGVHLGLPPIGDWTAFGATPKQSAIANDILIHGISLAEARAGVLRASVADTPRPN